MILRDDHRLGLWLHAFFLELFLLQFLLLKALFPLAVPHLDEVVPSSHVAEGLSAFEGLQLDELYRIQGALRRQTRVPILLGQDVQNHLSGVLLIPGVGRGFYI